MDWVELIRVTGIGKKDFGVQWKGKPKKLGLRTEIPGLFKK